MLSKSISSTKPVLLSGLQKEILSLYRTILREAAKKDLVSLNGTGDHKKPLVELWNSSKSQEQQESTVSSYARQEFRKQCASVKRKDFRTIEYKLRNGHKQVKLLQMPGVKVVGGSIKTQL